MLRMIVTILSLIGIAYLLYGALFYLNQRRIIFPGRRAGGRIEWLQPSEPAEQMWFEEDSNRVEAWLLPPYHPENYDPFPLAVIAHGNAALIDYWFTQTEGLRQRGIGALLVEFPGYGRSSGEPSQDSIRKLFIQAYDAVTARPEIDTSRILFIGRSLGGGVVCDLAKYRHTNGIILISTFTGIRAYATNYLLPGFLVRDHYDNIAALKQFPRPVIVIHAPNDETVPYSHGLQLVQAAQQGELITLPGGGHNHCIPDWEALWQELEPFLRKVGMIE